VGAARPALDLDGHVCWLCQPFLGKPTREQWLRLLDDVLRLRQEAGLDLSVVDPLAAFLPGSDENHAATVLQAVSPLRRLTAAGMAVLLQHHPRKASSADGRAAPRQRRPDGLRDVLVEMTWRAVRAPAAGRGG